MFRLGYFPLVIYKYHVRHYQRLQFVSKFSLNDDNVSYPTFEIQLWEALNMFLRQLATFNYPSFSIISHEIS